jgi:hypothetical protein
MGDTPKEQDEKVHGFGIRLCPRQIPENNKTINRVAIDFIGFTNKVCKYKITNTRI